MSWKNLPGWLKGGVIGGGVGLILHILITYLLPLIVGYIINSREILQTSCFICIFDYIKFIIFLIAGIILGTIIGFVIGKFKFKGETK